MMKLPAIRACLLETLRSDEESQPTDTDARLEKVVSCHSACTSDCKAGQGAYIGVQLAHEAGQVAVLEVLWQKVT